MRLHKYFLGREQKGEPNTRKYEQEMFRDFLGIPFSNAFSSSPEDWAEKTETAF